MKKKKKYIKKSKGCYLGNIDKDIKKLKKDMEKASENQEFERAIELRDRIINLERAGKKQKVSNFLHKSIDIIGIARNNIETHLTIFEVRGSNLDNKKTIILKDVEDIEEEEIIENYIMQTYGASDNILDIPEKIMLRQILPHHDILEKIISEKIGHKVEIIVPKKGEKLFEKGTKPYVTLSDAIGDLPFIKTGEESFEYFSEPQNDFQKKMRENAPLRLMDHSAPNNNARLVKIMENLPDGGSPMDLPEEMRPKSGFANTYCRLWWNRPSTTITRNLSTPSSSRCIHPRAPRPLTTREGARIQCFPDNYIFYGSRNDKNLQIGNAVPTFLSEVLKEQMKKYFEKVIIRN